jgi:hypothetical protein
MAFDGAGMTAAIRKQIERSRHKHAGSKRIEVVLDAGQLIDLETIKQAYGYNNAEAVSYAISAARLVLMRDRKA